jgi:hypothetical protein
MTGFTLTFPCKEAVLPQPAAAAASDGNRLAKDIQISMKGVDSSSSGSLLLLQLLWTGS